MTLQVEVQAVEESLRAQELSIADEQEHVEWKRWQVQELENSHRLSVRVEAEVSRRIALAKEQEAERLLQERGRKQERRRKEAAEEEAEVEAEREADERARREEKGEEDAQVRRAQGVTAEEE